MGDKNAYFQLKIAEDGLHLIMFPAEGNGVGISLTEVDSYISAVCNDYNREIVAANIAKVSVVKDVIVSKKKIYPVHERMVVSSREDRSEAEVRFYPPSNGGERLTAEAIKEQLVKAGVRAGIIEESIKRFLTEHPYCTSLPIAKAIAPQPGRDARITYAFNTEMSGKPKTNEDGSVDYHHIDIMSHVNAGDLLATLTPEIEGKPGMNISGVAIPAPKVAKKMLKYGKNIRVSEDGLQIFSEVSGHVSLVSDTVFVTDTYQVPANVDNSTGDINYKGNVEVVGNVNTGFKIEAEGNVIVNGVVEGAVIIAGGNIVLKCGIQGKGRGELHSGGNIISKFIESSVVEANGYVTAEAIMHSKVMANGDILVNGKKGLIVGGELHSTTLISAKVIGSVMGTTTSLEVGVSPEITEELSRLNSEISEMNKTMETMAPVLQKFTLLIKQGQKLDAVKMQQLQALLQKKKTMDAEMDEKLNRITVLHEIVDNCTGGSVCADVSMYPGCKLSISGVTGFVRTESKHCRFVRDGADVRATAYD